VVSPGGHRLGGRGNALKPKPNKFRNKLFASFCQKRELWMAKNVAAYIQLSARD